MEKLWEGGGKVVGRRWDNVGKMLGKLRGSVGKFGIVVENVWKMFGN